MKQFAIMLAAVCAVGVMSSESQAQHYGNRGGGFAISIGNGFSGFSYGNIGPRYGAGYGYGGGYARPVYARPIYGYGGGYRGGYGGYRGGYGNHRGGYGRSYGGHRSGYGGGRRGY